MRAGNLSKGILEPRSIRIDDVLNELSLSLLEVFGLLGELRLRTAKLYFLVGGPFFKLRHLTLCCHCLFFQLHHPGAQRQDPLLKINVILTFVEEPFLGLPFRLAEAAQFLPQRGFVIGEDLNQLSQFFLLFLLRQS